MIYRFGSFQLDTETLEAHRDGILVPMEPQVFRLLLYLVENRQRVVSKDELIDQIWQGRFVSDAAVTSRINHARRAIGDTGKEKRLIRTFPKRGFRFVFPVEERPDDPNRVRQEQNSAEAQPGHGESEASEQNVATLSFKELRSVTLLLVLPQLVSSDPEEFASEAATYRGAILSCEEATGAVMMDQTGASLICVFGAATPSESHAPHALDLANALAGNAALMGLRGGLVSGDIILNQNAEFDAGDTQAIAHLVAEANRLAEAADIGTFRISAVTKAHLRRRGDQIAADPKLGKSGPSTGTTVARESELVTIESELAKVLSDGSGRAVAVVGEAGIGKSTLLHLFLETAAVETCRVLFIEAFERTAQTAFAPLFGYFKQWVSSANGMDLEDPGRPEIEAIVPTELVAVLQHFVDRSATNLGWDSLESGLRRKRIADLLRFSIEAASADSPLILIVEDLHWIDPDTEALLDAVIDDLPAVPVLLLVTHRRNYTNRWIGRSFFQLVDVKALDEHQSMTLLNTLFGSGREADAVKSRIIERSLGIPFFLTEAAAGFASVRSGQGSDPEGAEFAEAADWELPPTIRDILSSRLQKLAPRERWVMQCASVFGMRVNRAAVSELADLSDSEIDESIMVLRSDELFVRTRGSDAFEHMFRHALLHDAAYASILRGDRQAMHGRALEILRSKIQNEDSDLVGLAYHALMSHDWDRAAEYYRDAADRFVELSAYRSAKDAYFKAIQALRNLPRSNNVTRRIAEIRLRLRPVLVPLGEFDAAADQLDKAHKFFESSGDSAQLVSVLIGKSYLFSTHGRLNSAKENATKAMEMAAAESQQAYEAKLALGQAQSMVADWHGVIDTLVPTLPYWDARPTERFGHMGTRSVWCHGHIARSYYFQGDKQRSHAHAKTALELATRTGRPADQTFAEHRLAEVASLKGDDRAGKALLASAMARADEAGIPIFATWVACDLAPLMIAAGELTEASKLIELHLAQAQELNLPQFAAWLTLRKAQLSFAEDDLARSLELGKSALQNSQHLGDPALNVAALRHLGLTNRVAGNAQGQIEKSAALAEELGLHLELTRSKDALN